MPVKGSPRKKVMAMRAIKKVTVVAAIVTAGALGFAAPALADVIDADVTVQPGIHLLDSDSHVTLPGVLDIGTHTNGDATVHFGLG